MPYPTEHAARVRDPGDFIPNSFRSKELKPGLRIIVGKLKGESSMTAQAYRFSVDKFTVDEAKTWLKDHKIPFIKFEPATKGEENKGMSENSLKHFGIMGMHWGRRKSSAEVLKEKDAKWEKTAIDRHKVIKAYNAAADRMNSGIIHQINNKPKYKGKNLFHNPELLKEYEKEYSKTFGKVLTEESEKIFGRNPSGTKRVRGDWSFETGLSFRFEDIKHDDFGISFDIQRDEFGFITKIEVKNMAQDTLQHIGVMGMHWGRRKGSLESGGGGIRGAIRRSAARQNAKDVASLRKHGFNKEADAVAANMKRSMSQKFSEIPKKKFGTGQKILVGVMGTIALISAASFVAQASRGPKINVDDVAKILNAARKASTIHL